MRSARRACGIHCPDLIEGGLSEGAGCLAYGDLAETVDGVWRGRAFAGARGQVWKDILAGICGVFDAPVGWFASTEPLVLLRFTSLTHTIPG